MTIGSIPLPLRPELGKPPRPRPPLGDNERCALTMLAEQGFAALHLVEFLSFDDDVHGDELTIF